MAVTQEQAIAELASRAQARGVESAPPPAARRFTDERPVPEFMKKDPPKGPIPPVPRRLLALLSSAERKQYPLASGCLDYFPDALALVSNVSWRGNQKHNPGQPMHHARGKSSDHADCIVRHLIERDWLDPDGIDHAAELAWRALAYLQEMLERRHNLDLPRGATAPGVEMEPVTER